MMSEKLPVHRLVVLGDLGVGKTTLVFQMTGQSCDRGFDSTAEDLFTHTISLGSGTCDLSILDTGGNPEYAKMRAQWIKHGTGFLIIYDVASRKSFELVREIQQEIVNIKENRYHLVLVGNKKTKVGEKQVSTEEGEVLAQELGCSFFEVSVKTHAEAIAPVAYLLRLMEPRYQTCVEGPGFVASPSWFSNLTDVVWLDPLRRLWGFIWKNLWYGSARKELLNQSHV